MAEVIILDEKVLSGTAKDLKIAQTGQHDKEKKNENFKKKFSFSLIVNNFHPAWFGVTLSWGSFALVVDNIPLNRPGHDDGMKDTLRILALIIWGWNSLYFLLFILIMALNYKNVLQIFNHPKKLYFLGTFGLSTAIWIASVAELCEVGLASFILWWISLFIAIFIYLSTTFRVILDPNKHLKNLLSEMEGYMILPCLPLVTNAVAGTFILPQQENDNVKITIIITSYIILGMEAFIAFIFLSNKMTRLVQNGYSQNFAHTIWICVAPVALTASVIMKLATLAQEIPKKSWVSAAGDENSAEILLNYAKFAVSSSFFIGLNIFGAALFFAMLSSAVSIAYIYKVGIRNLKLNLTYWTIIFPLTTLTLTSFTLTSYTNFLFFYITSWILALIETVLVLVIHVATIYQVFFNADEWWHSFQEVKMISS